MPPEVRNVIIVGSGPAGYTAAIYAARANLKPVLFEGSVTAGGALMTKTEIENLPGFRDGITGPDLMEAMRAEAERFGAELIRDDVTEVSLGGAVKTVTEGEGRVWAAHTVILAMGSAYRQLRLPDDQVRSIRDDRAPSRRAPGFQDHGRPRDEQRQDPLRLELRCAGDPRWGQGHWRDPA